MQSSMDRSNEADPNPRSHEIERAPSVPEHQLLRRIGKGSYGEVWLARSRLGTFRAVKIIAWDNAETEAMARREYGGIQRFEPVSRSHEGLVDVLQVGREEHAGFFYYVMELADDRRGGSDGSVADPEAYAPRTLADALAERGRLPIDECIKLGLRLSDAIEHLHARGLVHRDIKPSNVVFVQGEPKLADIGLVTEIDAARTYVGTAGFIPPEGPGTPQADVYSLGKVLYEICTGLDRHQFPALPADLHAWPDAERMLELNEILLKACHAERTRRYASAHDLNADLVALVHGKSIKRLRWLEDQVLALKRLGMAAAVGVAILAGLGYAVLREFQHSAAARQREVGGKIADGTHAVDQGDLLAALPSFVSAWQLDPGERESMHRLHVGTVLNLAPKLTQIWSAERPVRWVEFSPDGARVLAALEDGSVNLWSALNGQPVGSAIGPPRGLEMASFDPTGRRMVTASLDRTAIVWDLETGTALRQLLHPRRVLSAHFSPDGLQVVTACEDRSARIWNVERGEVEQELKQHTGILRYAEFSHDGRHVATCGDDSIALIWDVATGAATGPPLRHESWVYHAAFSPDDRLLVTASYDRTARVWDVASGQEQPPPMRHGDGVRSAEFSPDGRWIVTASLDRKVRIWEAYSRQLVHGHPEFKHSGRVMYATFAPDGHRVATASLDGIVRVWDLAGAAPVLLERRPAASSDQGRVVTWRSTAAEVVDLGASTAAPVSIRPAPGAVIRAAKIASNGRRVLTLSSRADAASGRTNELQVWNALTGAAIAPAIPLNALPSDVVFTDAGEHVVCVEGKTARIYALPKDQPCATITSAQPISRAMLSPDGSVLLTVAARVAELWDASSGVSRRSAPAQTSPIHCVQFSPDGGRFVTGCKDDSLNPCSAQVWDARTAQPHGLLLRHADGVCSVDFSLDGRRVATSSEDFTAMVWDADSGEPVTSPLRHEAQVFDAAFSPNGQWLVTACADRTVRIWEIGTSRPLIPPVRYPELFLRVCFTRDGSALVIHSPRDNPAPPAWPGSGAERALLWPLRYASGTIDDWREVATYATGSTPETGRSVPGRTAWESLRRRHPEAFTVSAAQIKAWYREQLDACEGRRLDAAARFHADQVRALPP